MARTFVAASSQKLASGSAVLTASPITMACWFKPVSNTVNYALMCLGASNGADNSRFTLFGPNGAGSKIQAQSNPPTGSAFAAVTSTTVATGTWQHACGVYASTTSRAAYLNGGGKGTETTSVVPTNIDRTRIGCRIAAGVEATFTDGDIAEAAIWSIDLSDADVAALATGLSPLLVRPDKLAAYWPILGVMSPEITLRGGFDLTVTGATAAAHTRVFYPHRRNFSGKAGAAPPATGGIRFYYGNLDAASIARSFGLNG